MPACEWGFWVCWKLSAAEQIKPDCCRTPAGVVPIFPDSAACVLSFYHSTPLHILIVKCKVRDQNNSNTPSHAHDTSDTSCRQNSLWVNATAYSPRLPQAHTFSRSNNSVIYCSNWVHSRYTWIRWRRKKLTRKRREKKRRRKNVKKSTKLNFILNIFILFGSFMSSDVG